MARLVLVGERARGDRDLDGVIEGHQPEVVGRVKAGDQRLERVLGRLEAAVGHRAAAVEHDLERARGSLGSGVAAGRDQLQQHGDLVLGLDRDDIEIKQGVEIHVGGVAGATDS